MIGRALKGIKRPAPRVPAKPAPSVVPNQGYGKVAPIGAPQTIPAADRARIDEMHKKLGQQTPQRPKMPIALPSKPIPRPTPVMGKGLAGLSPALLSSLAGKAKLKKGGVVKKTAAKKGKK